MRLTEFTESEKLPSMSTPGPKALAAKHGVPLSQIMQQLFKGVKVEKEHTSDVVMAREIALDHINEIPDYYDRLERMERDALKEAGVGIITKQNSTVDVKPGETTRQANKFNLELDSKGHPKLLRSKT